MPNGEYVEGSYFFYAPNRAAAFFFTVAFLISGLVHAWQCWRYKSWLLTALFPFCSLLFVAGFALRVYGSFHYDILNVYIASICITYAAPPLLELQNYHTLGRVLYYVPYRAPLHPGRVLTTFGFISSIVEALNGWGASLSANQSLDENQIETGHSLTKASLLIQIFVIACFVLLATVFHRACVKHGQCNKVVSSSLITLYVSMTLILIRTIYRIVEYFGVAQIRFNDPNLQPGDISPMIRYEWYLYVFEASLMLINNAMWNFRHPRRYLPESNKTYLSQDGVTEMQGPGYKDPRPLWQTLVDPFDIKSMIGKRNLTQQSSFWETNNSSVNTSADKTGRIDETV